MTVAASATIGCDVIVVGAGIAAASLGFHLAPHARVILLERESQPGYHSTGRSAALYLAAYGPPQVRALTIASRAFLDDPPAGFTDGPILSPRGAMWVASCGEEALLESHWQTLRSASPTGRRLDARQTLEQMPVLRADTLLGAAWEPDAADIDVNRLHQGFLRAIRKAGGVAAGDAEVTRLVRRGSTWHVTAGNRSYAAPIVVDAAGAWCDVVARLAAVAPIGLVPKRRTAITFAPPAGTDSSRWPSVIAADESWYVKPDAGVLLGSPANADATDPQDVQPEELDIALAIDRIERATTLSVRPIRAWAGLRSFVADGGLVGGFDDSCDGFFWLAGQGGYGIQSAPAMGEACAALVSGGALPKRLSDAGIDADALGPARLRGNR